jgi:2,4-didehydro-3-deoxy-L-rhamnonate hydrolase
VFALGTFAPAAAGPFPGLVVNDRVIDLRTEYGSRATVNALLDDWDNTLPLLHALARRPPVDSVTLNALQPLPPVQPGQILCAGANYYKHTVEMTTALLRNQAGQSMSETEILAEARATAERQASSGAPFLFAGLPSALSGARDDVILWGPGAQHDWELELGVVIGRTCSNISADQAMDHVAGYTVSNDISTRDVMFRPKFALTDFLTSKSRPTFFPTGPYLVPREFVEDYRKLRITLKINGETMQDETIDDIMYGVEDLIAHASAITTLYPGDIVLTGSPAGNAAAHGGRWLQPGDLLEGEITGLGVQRNRCVADPRAAS